VRLLRDRGATVVEVSPPYLDRLAELEYPVMFTEFRREIEAYLATRDGVPQTLAELIEFNRADPLERACFASQDIFESSAAAPGPDDPTYLAQRAELTELARRCLDEVLDERRLDAIVAPSMPPAWLSNCASGDPDVRLTSTPAAAGGYPSTSVPAGFVGPLPVGISFISRRWADARTLAYAAEFEAMARARRPPKFLSSYGTE